MCVNAQRCTDQNKMRASTVMIVWTKHRLVSSHWVVTIFGHSLQEKKKYNELGEIYLREESITFCVGVIIGIYTKFFPLALHNPIVGVYFTALYRALASSRTRLLDHTQRRATVGRIPLNEWSVRHRDLYLKTHNTHNRQISMPRVGFEPTIAAGERP